jgi:hypothetical protein
VCIDLGSRLLEPITVPRANNAKPRPPRAVQVFPHINYYYSPMLSGGDSSRHCIKLSIAEAEVGFCENNETVGEMFLASPKPQLTRNPTVHRRCC